MLQNKIRDIDYWIQLFQFTSITNNCYVVNMIMVSLNSEKFAIQ